MRLHNLFVLRVPEVCGNSMWLDDICLLRVLSAGSNHGGYMTLAFSRFQSGEQ